MIYRLLEYILRLLVASWRIKIDNAYSMQYPVFPAVIAFWHCEMLPIWKAFSDRNATAVVSKNKDGEILARLLSTWHYELIRGSSTRGGKEVIQQIVDKTDSDFFLITPDGPRGPSKKCKPGAFVIAQRKQIPLYFVKCKIGWKKIFYRSWDKFILPLPFSKIIISIGEKIDIPTDTAREHITLLMQEVEKKYI